MSNQSSQINLKWIEEQTNAYKQKHESFEKYAELLKLLFQQVAKDRDIDAIIQVRAKTIASFWKRIIKT